MLRFLFFFKIYVRLHFHPVDAFFWGGPPSLARSQLARRAELGKFWRFGWTQTKKTNQKDKTAEQKLQGAKNDGTTKEMEMVCFVFNHYSTIYEPLAQRASGYQRMKKESTTEGVGNERGDLRELEFFPSPFDCMWSEGIHVSGICF